MFSHSVMSISVWCHELQHTRLSSPSPSPRASWNSFVLSQWCYLAISSSVVPFSCFQSFPASGSFFNKSALRLRWPKYWSFSFSSSLFNDYSGMISLGLTDLISLLSKGLSRVFSTPQFKSINFLAHSFLYSSNLTFIHDYWKKPCFDFMGLCQQSNVSAF